MNNSRLQFRVGLFVIVAMVLTAGMAFKFGEIKTYWDKEYAIAIHFETAPGVRADAPVQTNGITIGKVREVILDQKRGGITVVVDIREQYRLRKDTRPRLVQSLLGDATIEFTPGMSGEFLRPGTLLEGEAPVDPMQIVNHLDEQITTLMESFAATSSEWEKVARNINGLMDTQQGNLNVVVERAAESLAQFTATMTTANEALKNANRVLNDPQYQENLKQTMNALPTMMEDTRLAISAVRSAVTAADRNLTNLEQVTSPLAKRSTSIATRLDNSLGNLEELTSELTLLTKMLNREDGSLQKFAADPELYRNMNRSAESLALLLRNLEPVLSDLRIFSDKIARHPELIGVSGAMKGSSGLKDPESNGVRPAGFETQRR